MKKNARNKDLLPGGILLGWAYITHLIYLNNHRSDANVKRSFHTTPSSNISPVKKP